MEGTGRDWKGLEGAGRRLEGGWKGREVRAVTGQRVTLA